MAKVTMKRISCEFWVDDRRKGRIEGAQGPVSPTLGQNLLLPTGKALADAGCIAPFTPRGELFYMVHIPTGNKLPFWICGPLKSMYQLACELEDGYDLEFTDKKHLPEGMPNFTKAWMEFHCPEYLPPGASSDFTKQLEEACRDKGVVYPGWRQDRVKFTKYYRKWFAHKFKKEVFHGYDETWAQNATFYR